MKPLIAITLFGSVLALSAIAAPPDQLLPDEKAKIGPVPLEGGYSIVSGERDGKPIPEDEIKGFVVRFTRHDIVGTDKDCKDLYMTDYTVDTSKTPWRIEMTSIRHEMPFPLGVVAVKGNPTKTTGLVKKEANAITLVYALPGGEAPTEFKTKAKQQMLVMKSFAIEGVFPNKFPEEP